MSNFLHDFDIRQLGLTENVELLSDVGYYSTRFKIVVIMRAGFMTDLDSIPTILKSVVRASPKRSWRAYCLHDALFRKGYDQKTSDLILDEALTILKISFYSRQKVYYGLRMFGNPTTNEELLENALQYIEIHDCSAFKKDWLSDVCEYYLDN